MDYLGPSDYKWLAKADLFAATAHRNQLRKYTGGPYIDHPREVMVIIRNVASSTLPMLLASLLHDTVEDTPATLEEVLAEFDSTTARLVDGLTKREHPGNRNVRAREERHRLDEEGPEVQTIKVADVISNTRNLPLVCTDLKYVRMYFGEKRLLLDRLTKADPGLLDKAWAILDKGPV